MLQRPNSGTFIVFEGLDGSGSSTQISLLADYLEHEGYKVLVVKQPSPNMIGGLIRGQLTHDWHTSPECLQLLFAADRAHQVEREIIPALRAGAIVLADRHLYSSIAFGQVDGLGKDWLWAINSQVPEPDAVILMKVAPEECMARIKKTRFTQELFEQIEKLRTVWGHYEEIATHVHQCHVVNGERPKDVVAKEIQSIIAPYIKPAPVKLPL